MQNTLLGVAIAVILALIGALVAPHFIDWTQYRAAFEQEATRVIGLSVRVAGAIDARLLPTPSLRLRRIAVGAPGEPPRLSADQLDVEFSLGALLRGEWRASDLTLRGMALAVGLDDKGRVDWPAQAKAFNLGGLTIDRLALAGGVTLRDSGSGTAITLADASFVGDVRPQASALRGEGAFTLEGVRVPYRISTARNPEGAGTRLRLTFDAPRNGPSVDADGILSLTAGAAKFDGAVTVARTSGAWPPWRLVAKGVADAHGARVESADLLIGPEETGLRLSGTATLARGATPAVQARLVARAFEAERVLTLLGEPAGAPLLAIARLDEAFAALPGIGFATQLDVSAEQFTWGGRAVQGLALGMRGGQEGWRVEQLALRAPGSARVAAQGRANATSPVGFDGALTLEAADAALLWAWLSGQPDSAAARTRPLRATSELTVAPGRIALRQLKAESAPLALTGAATFDRTRNERQAAFSLTAPALEPLAGLLAPHAPELAARLAALAPHDGVATLDATLDAGATVGRGDDTPVVQVTLRAPGLGIEASLAAPAAALAQAPDVALMGVPLTWRAQATTARAASLIAALGLQGIVAGDAGTGVVTADGTTTLAEALRAPVPLRVLLVTPTADVTLAGQWDARGRGGFAPGALDVRTADLAPLFGLDVEATMPVSGRAVLARTPDRISLTGIDARLLGSSVRGQLEITSGEPPQVTGTLEADRLDAGAMLALLTGAHAKAAPDPLARGVAGRWRGRIGVSAPEATLFAGTSARALAFTLQGTAQGVDVDALTASMGEGALAGRLHLQRTDDGLALDAEATLRNANAGALRHHALALAGGRADVRLSIAGKGRSHAALLGALNGEGQVSLRDARLAGLGPRAVAVVEQAVDVRPAPDAARVRSALDRALAEGALAVAAAEIPFTVRDGRVRAGRTVLAGDGAALSVSGGYDLAAGGVDAHATLSLTPSAEHAGRPPEVVLTWRGTALAPVRTLDVAATMNWIALRAVERETRRLDALERESRVPAAPNPSVPPVVVPAPEIIAPEPPAPSGVSVPAFNAEQLMPLPPPIDVRPAPGTKKRAPTAAPALPPARPPLSLTPAPPPS